MLPPSTNVAFPIHPITSSGPLHRSSQPDPLCRPTGPSTLPGDNRPTIEACGVVAAELMRQYCSLSGYRQQYASMKTNHFLVQNMQVRALDALNPSRLASRLVRTLRCGGGSLRGQRLLRPPPQSIEGGRTMRPSTHYSHGRRTLHTGLSSRLDGSAGQHNTP